MLADCALQTTDAVGRIRVIGYAYIHRTDIYAHLAFRTRSLNMETHEADAVEQRV